MNSHPSVLTGCRFVGDNSAHSVFDLRSNSAVVLGFGVVRVRKSMVGSTDSHDCDRKL